MMLASFLSELSGFFDRRFIIAHWAPAFIAVGLSLTGAALYVGQATAAAWWTDLTGIEQAWFGLGTLLSVTVVAFLLQALSLSLLRLYEGYWPRWLDRLARWAQADQAAKHAGLRQDVSQADIDAQADKVLDALHQSGAYRELFEHYPRNANLLRPTRLGNTMTAAEEYPYQMYRLDSVLWWPRLWPKLPAEFRSQIDAALTPLLSLLNLSTLFTALALGGGSAVVVARLDRWLFVAVFAGGLVLAWLSYRAAVSQATQYGSLVRVAFDLHRHEILKEMHISVPDNLVEERVLWEKLNWWVAYYVQPWEIKQPPAESDWPEDRFYYDTHTAPAKPTVEETRISLLDVPLVTIRRRTVPDD